MTKDLKTRVVTGVFWRGAESLATQFVLFFVGIVLARILEPEEFGLLAMLAIFIALSNTFINSGFGSALVQRKETTFEDECSVFYFNIFVSITVYLILYVASPQIALFYKEPQLETILRITSLSLIIRPLGLVQSTLLSKSLDFKKLFKVNIFGNTVSGAVGVTMAYRGFGVWALVASSLTAEMIRLITIWFISSWRPKLIFSFKSLQSLFGYGSKILLAELLESLFLNIYGLLIGKFYTATDLAFFNRGRSLPNMIVTSINGTIGSVMFPALSKIQDDNVRMKSAVRRTLTTVSVILWPVLIGLTVVAEPFVQVVLTDKWLPAVPYLQIMCLSFALYPIHITNLQVIRATGRSDIILKLQVIKKTLLLAIIVVTLPISIFAMVLGQFFLGFIGAFLNGYYTKRFINYSFYQQIQDLLPIGLTTTIMAGAVYVIGLTSYSNVYIQLLIQILTGILVYFGVCRMTRLRAFYEMLDIAKEMVQPKKDSNRAL